MTRKAKVVQTCKSLLLSLMEVLATVVLMPNLNQSDKFSRVFGFCRIPQVRLQLGSKMFPMVLPSPASLQYQHGSALIAFSWIGLEAIAQSRTFARAAPVATRSCNDISYFTKKISLCDIQ